MEPAWLLSSPKASDRVFRTTGLTWLVVLTYAPISRPKQVRGIVASSGFPLRIIEAGLCSRAFRCTSLHRCRLLTERSEQTAFSSVKFHALVGLSVRSPERSGTLLYGSVSKCPLFASLEGSLFSSCYIPCCIVGFTMVSALFNEWYSAIHKLLSSLCLFLFDDIFRKKKISLGEILVFETLFT